MPKIDFMPPPRTGDKRKSALQSLNIHRGNSDYRMNNADKWMRAIQRDRNWCRALMGLPLIAPVDPAVVAWCRSHGSGSLRYPTQ